MGDPRKHSSTNNIVRFVLRHSTTGQGLTGLGAASAGLIISTICDVESVAVEYTVAAGNVETVTTLGTYETPTAGKCRFREVDATNHKGLYEFHFADARFAVANAKRMVVQVQGAANLLDGAYEILLTQLDLFDAQLASDASFLRKTKTNIIRDKAGSPGVRELLDDDDTTPIAEITLSQTTPYQSVTVL